MANNYVHFSFAVNMWDSERRAWVERLLKDPDELYNDEDEEFEEVFPNYGDFDCLGFDWDIDLAGELWLHDEEGTGNTDHVSGFLQAYLKKFNIEEPVAFEFAFTCSKPRLDEFGGGAVVVTKDEIHWMSTNSWILDKLQELEKGYAGTS